VGDASADQAVDVGDAQTLITKAVAITDDVSLAARLGAKNRHRAGSVFSLANMIDRYQQLFNSLDDRHKV
jgi:hypothetical protein